MTSFNPSVDTTIFPRINFLKTFGPRFAQRSANGRIFLSGGLFGNASLDLNFASTLSLTDSVSGNNLVTFTRASSATYVGADGLIKTTPVNLLRYSERFDNAAYNKQNGTPVTPNQVAAPDGTLTADLVTFAVSSQRLFQNVTGTGTFTLSVYARVASGSTDFNLACFNNIDGTQKELITVTDTWQRFSATFTVTNNSDWHPIRFETAPTEVYIWGAQLEEGSTATDYIPTTSTATGAPRFDHDPATGESLGLLIEEARTNLIVNSAGDIPEGRQQMTVPVSVDGPAGSGTAYQYLSVGGTVGSRLRLQNVNVTTGSQYTATIYIKGVNYDTVTFGFSITGFPAQSRRRFYLDTLTSQGGGGAVAETSIEDVGNGWRRLRMTTVAANADATTLLFLDLGATADETHSTNEGFQIYGIQVEEGSFPTSYIPTSGSTVTRAADIGYITQANMQSWYNQSEGTIFSESFGYYSGGGIAYFGSNTEGWGLFSNANALRNKGRGAFRPDYTAGYTPYTADAFYNFKNAISINDSTGLTYSAVNGTAYSLSGSERLGPFVYPTGFGLAQADVVKATAHSIRLKRISYFPVGFNGVQLQNITS